MKHQRSHKNQSLRQNRSLQQNLSFMRRWPVSLSAIFVISILALCLVQASLFPIHAQTTATPPSEDKTFVVAMSSFPRSVDPHFRSAQPDFNIAWNLYQPLLVDQPNAGRTEYILATDFQQSSPTTWIVNLKKDQLFSDGSPFTAEDVVHSFQRARHHPDYIDQFPPMAAHLKLVKKVEAMSTHEIRVTTSVPNADVVHNLGRIMIVKKPADGSVGNKDSFNNGSNAIGTGPYRFIGYTDSGDITVHRNEHYQGDTPFVKRARFTYYKNDADRLQGFVDGKVDLIDKLVPAEIDWLRKRASLNISRTDTHRLQFIMLHSDKTSPFVFDKKSGQPLKENPLADQRVRHAIVKAIDKNYLIRKIIGIDAHGANSFALPAYTTAPVQTSDYDPDAARALLKSAGYTDGFKLTIHGPNDRYILDEVILEEIAGMLSKVGIETTAVTFPKKVFFEKRNKFSYSAFFAGLSYTGNALKMIETMHHTRDSEKLAGDRNFSGIGNPKIDALIAKAESTLDPAVRRIYLRQLTQLALDQATVIPLYFEPSIWGVRTGMEYHPNPFERTLAKDVFPAL